MCADVQKKGNSFLFHLIDCQWIQCRRKVQSSRKLRFLHGDHALKDKSKKFNHLILPVNYWSTLIILLRLIIVLGSRFTNSQLL